MQRLNRPAHAPLGMAFFLFLGLAIVPVSLKAAGVHLSFSPSLSAAADAWKEISEVFGASYQQSRDPQLPAVTNADSDATTSDSDCTKGFVACTGGTVRVPLSTTVLTTISPKSQCPRSPRAIIRVRTLPSITGSESDSTRIQAEVKLEETTKLLKSLAVMKLDAVAHKTLNDAESHAVQRRFEQREFFRSIPKSTSLRVLLQLRPPVVAPSAARRPVECKVRLASTRRDDSEQDAPDNASSFDDFDL
jgi:hypothetical protein